jgi:pimeloyl-ACP methyl ester carboxylesterase/biotin carboxyl carrier protein
MQLVLTMPRLGETMDEGTILGWLVPTGVAFKRGDAILELETDTTVVEYPALGDGVLDEVLVGPSDRIAVGAPIAKVTVSNEADWSDANAPAETSKTTAPAAVSILTMPRLGETMEEGVIGHWLVAEGAAYVRGDAILEIETDKTAAEVPALSDGRLLRVLAQPGDRIAVGQPIAEVEGDVEPVETAQPVVRGAISEPVTKAASAIAISPCNGRLRATPLARRIARQKGISLQNLTGSGRRGRIERADVERAESAVVGVGWLETPAGRIAYEVNGTGARTYLLIHGFAGDRSAWAVTAAALRRAGHRTAIFDLPGHGETEADAVGLDSLTDGAAALAAELPSPLVLVGHSLGAVVAVALASRLGEKVVGLVLLTPAGCGPQIGADFVHGMAGATTAGEVGHLLRLLGPKGGSLSEAVLTQMAEQMARGRLKTLGGALASAEGRQRIDMIRALRALPETLPLRAVFGIEDRIVAATDALNLPGRIATHFLPTGHMPQWDAPRDVVDLILKGHKNE